MKKVRKGSHVNIWGKSVPGPGNSQCKYLCAWPVRKTAAKRPLEQLGVGWRRVVSIRE